MSNYKIEKISKETPLIKTGDRVQVMFTDLMKELSIAGNACIVCYEHSDGLYVNLSNQGELIQRISKNHLRKISRKEMIKIKQQLFPYKPDRGGTPDGPYDGD